MQSTSLQFKQALILAAVAGLAMAEAVEVQAQTARAQTSIQSMTLARDPEKLGFSKARLDRLGAIFDSKIAEKMWPGSVSLIARHGQLVHFESHGSLDSAGQVPMRRDAIFRVMSMTKPVVSVAAMTLVERGIINIDDPIERYLPELKDVKVANPADASAPLALERSITVYDLLRHVSGFTWARATDATRPKHVREIANAYAAADLHPGSTDQTPEQFLAKLGAIPLIHQPGTAFEYGISTDVLGALVERVTRQRLDLFVKKTVFEPLEMHDSDWYVPTEKRARLADAFDADRAKAGIWRSARGESPPATQLRYAGGGLFSTASDYFRFAQMLLNGGELNGVRLLSPKTVELMTANHIEGLGGSPAAVSGPGYGFGLGFAVRIDVGAGVVPGSIGDAYWPGIGGTSFTVDRKEGLVALYFVQAPSNRIAARHMFKNVVYGAMTQ